MAEVLLQFDAPVRDETGHAYTARACGRAGDNGLWDGWIEFTPLSGGTTLRTERETTQPNRRDLEYWASGLTETYLEGALERAQEPRPAPVPPIAVEPAYEGPRPSPEATPVPPRAGIPPRAVLDPFEVYAQGEDVLRDELTALADGHLRNIIQAYALAEVTPGELAQISRPVLIDLIVSGVRRRRP